MEKGVIILLKTLTPLTVCFYRLPSVEIRELNTVDFYFFFFLSVL